MDYGMFGGLFGSMRDDAERTAENAGRAADEVASLKAELEQLRQELADFQAEQQAQHEANAIKADLDAKKAFRHDYCVGAFGVALTLAIEHHREICDFVRGAVIFVWSLFH